MAKILNKDPVTYQRERDGFIRDLQQFHESRGSPFRKIPKINGHEIDLYLLYVLVTAHGGWVKVNSRNEWETLVEEFNLPRHCVNSGVALKQIYLRFLDRYEKVHYLGEDVDRGSDDDEDSRHKRWSARALHNVPLSYNHNQHNVAEGTRAYNGLSAELFRPSDYDRLALSLLSPLPNEQDFAMNVCTLLSNEGKHTLKLEKCPRLVDVLLAHAGVFNHVSLREVFDEVYNDVRRVSLRHFWEDTLEDPGLVDLSDERKFLRRGGRGVNMTEGEEDLAKMEAPRKCGLQIEPFEKELFCLGRTFGTQDPFGQRVLQVATILRNLSFGEENLSILARNTTFLRFLLLCVGSRWSTLHQLGFDMLGNVASELVVEDPANDRLSGSLMGIVTSGLSSSDRYVVLSCLEVLNKLSQNDENEEVMLRCLDQRVYDQVCSFLSLHDIMLLVYTLECLYALSSLGERACNGIARVHGAIDTLVSLITVEAQSYGPKACILMRVVETVSGTHAGSTTSTTTTSTAMATPTVTAVPTTTNLRPIAPATPHRQIPTQKVVIGAPQPAVATPVSLAQTPQQYQQQQHAHQQAAQENEQFALAWLRATYEPGTGTRIEQGELYKQYLTACAKVGRRGVIAPLHFPRCVRSVFGGSVGPNYQKTANTTDNLAYYEGIKVRAIPYTVNIGNSTPTVQQPTPRKNVHIVAKTVTPPPPSPSASPVPPATPDNLVVEGAIPAPASPILKAQLSAPPKQRETPKGDVKSQVLAHPHLSQALLGNGGASSAPKEAGGCSTSLIKSLLATKVNSGECMTKQPTASMVPASPLACASINTQPPAQVTQRQQQQRLLQQQLQSQKKDSTSPPPLVPTSSSTTQAKNFPNVVVKTKLPEQKPRVSRINGVRSTVQVQEQMEGVKEGESVMSSSSGGEAQTAAVRGRREPPQPPPPPLAPLSGGLSRPRLDPDDSDNSLASSRDCGVNVSTDDGENSLTSFEGLLLNGIPHALDIDGASNSSSKDSAQSGSAKTKSLMLADLLEKKVDKKDPPILNGVLAKQLRIGEKGLELVENHLDKVLNAEPGSTVLVEDERTLNSSDSKILCSTTLKTVGTGTDEESSGGMQAVKRPAENDLPVEVVEPKRPHLEGVNGDASSEEPSLASSSAANLYAALAADALEDEPELEPPPRQTMLLGPDPLLLPRQILMSPGQAPVLLATGSQRPQMVLSQGGAGQIILSQAGPGQYLVSGGAPGQPHYVVAQPQTALVQGQTQTVLVAQTTQQQGTSAKTIIILQPQNAGATHHQKVVMTPQGQQVVVTQVPRPILQSPAITTASLHPPALVPTTTVHAPALATMPAPAPRPTKPAAPQPVVARSPQPIQPSPTPPSSSPQPRLPIVSTAPAAPSARPVKMVQNSRPPEDKAGSPGPVRSPKPLPPPPPVPAGTQKPSGTIDQSMFLCEWRGCMRSFKSANEVYMHACESHCPSGSEEIQCLWERCDAMRRKRFSLMTHLYDRHCNADVLRMMAVRRKQLSQSGRSEIPPPQPPPPHPGYAPNAAFHAIKRHALEFVNPKEMMSQKPVKVGPPVIVPTRNGPSPPEQDDNEGPVTKSIRLTSSLILRNLVIYSTNGRRFLRSYEPHLASVALSNVESSRTIAQILYDMNQQAIRR